MQGIGEGRKRRRYLLTARLPESLYEGFKAYCNELGLSSISEAVCLLVEHELTAENAVSEEIATTKEYKKSDDVVVVNINVADSGEVLSI
ncbi:hypothetical protein [Peribacillus asahii]|uniref:hypothetical protein n=1 Tax=Peribacillus asahii TaxID=228899 RepID=UPI00381200F6